MIRTVVSLVDFHLTRLTGQASPMDDLFMAEGLVEDLKSGCWPSIAIAMDYGIESSSHFGALQAAYRGGWNVYDWDRVLGDGRAITQLILAVPEQPYPHVRFFTMDDDFRSPTGRDEWLWENI